MKRWLMAAQAVLAIICITWLYHSIDWRAVWKEFGSVSLPALGVVFLQRYFPYLALGMRLEFIFPEKVAFFEGFKASLLCVGCNNVLPARGGELVKIFWLGRESAFAYSLLFSGVFLERLLDITALLLLALIFALPFLEIWLAAVLACLLVCAWLAVFWLGTHGEKTGSMIKTLALSSKMGKWIESFLRFLGASVDGAGFGRIVCATMLVWAMNYLHVFLLANFLLNMNLDFKDIGILSVAIFFSSGLMLIPGGIGGMEFLIVTLLGVLGVDGPKAAVAAIFARLFYAVPPLLGALGVLLLDKSGLYGALAEIKKGTTRIKH